MANPWFRLYSEIIDDEKIRLLAFEDRWHFVAILCLKNSGFFDKTHKGDLLRRGMSVKLGVNGVDLDNLKARLMEVDLIDQDWQPKGWDRRQFKSDDSKERVREYRRKREANGLPKSSGGYLKHWEDIVSRDGPECVYCGSSENTCLDHMVPIVQGGTDDPLNLCIACKKCNSGKSGRTPEQAGYAIRNPITLDCYKRYCERVTTESNRVTVTVTAQEADTDTETEKKNGSAVSGPDGPAPCPHQKIIDLYHTHLPELRRVREWTKVREQHLQSRWREKPERQSLEWWERFFKYIAKSEFLMGRTEKPFSCDLEWIVRPTNFVKIVEGKYHA